MPSDAPDTGGVEGDLIVFDGTCVFCSGFARFVAARDGGRFAFVTAHSPTGQAIYDRYGLDGDAMETNIVIIDGQVFLRMGAFAAVMRSLGWPWRAASILDLPPAALTGPTYDVIARNRYRFGRRACPVPSPELRARLVE